MSRQTLKNQLNRKLNSLNGKELQEWLNAVKEIPELVPATEGIYCGRDGSIKEEIGGEYKDIFLTMGWYTVSTTPKVEYAYVS